MKVSQHHGIPYFGIAVGLALAPLAGGLSVQASAQQVLQRGALGRPAQVMDETGQWTTPLPVASDTEVEMYAPDVSTADWLQRNYGPFFEKQQYRISFFTFYKSQRACRQNQIAWGFADQAHLEACVDIGYRLRQVLVDVGQKTVTLESAAMLSQDGLVVPDSGPLQPMSRTWAQLDPLSRKALEKTTEFVAEQEKSYDKRLNHGH